MNAGQSMLDLTGWAMVSCLEADIVRNGSALAVSSTLTDLYGSFGPAVLYTEWEDAETGDPMLRDYLWSPHGDARCEHHIPTPPTIPELLERALGRLDAEIDALYAAGAADRDTIMLSRMQTHRSGRLRLGLVVVEQDYVTNSTTVAWRLDLEPAYPGEII